MTTPRTTQVPQQPYLRLALVLGPRVSEVETEIVKPRSSGQQPNRRLDHLAIGRHRVALMR
jgi:hypothetical protein